MTPASLTGGQPSSWLTLGFIMLVELFFKGREDLERHRSMMICLLPKRLWIDLVVHILFLSR
mgnify:CR=1 FL=1